MAGHTLALGCAVGTDAVALAAAGPERAKVFAAFGPRGAGAWRGSAVAAVRAHAAAGGAVAHWAGGCAARPLRARLAARTRAAVRAADAGLVAFFATPGSRGTALACRVAAERGLPVWAFALGFAPMRLARPGNGIWTPASRAGAWEGAWEGAWRWSPDQARLP